MKPSWLMLLALVCSVSCKTPKEAMNSISPKKAYWYNWVGGQPGIGGTNYEIHIAALKGSKTINFETLALDGQIIPIDRTEPQDSVYILFASENKSNRSKDVIGGDRPSRPDFRKKNPEKAVLTGTLDGESFELELNNFEEKPNKNLP